MNLDSWIGQSQDVVAESRLGFVDDEIGRRTIRFFHESKAKIGNKLFVDGRL